jgi:hypothetical protein
VTSRHFVFLQLGLEHHFVKADDPPTIPNVAAERHTVVYCAAQCGFAAKLLRENAASFCHGSMLTPTPNDDVSQ